MNKPILGILLSSSVSALLLCTCATPMPMPSGDPRVFMPVGGKAPAAETILSFTVASPAVRGIVNRFDHTIKLFIPGASVANIVPTIGLKSGITVVSPTTPSIDLSSPVTYVLSDGSSYVVSASIAASPTAATVDAWLGKGINLGNDLDAWPNGEGSWTEGVVAQEYMFDDFKTMGFDSVRIPITWGASANKADRLSDAGFSSIVNPVFMARVDTVAGWGLDAGLAVVINAHHEYWIRTTTGTSYTAQKPRFEALWTQIAEHFKSWPPQLVFEIINEPWGDMTNADVNDLNATILAIIRTSNPTRTVILGANSWNSMFAMQDGVFTVPSPASDPYIIANFHNYNPYSFCGYSTGTWGSTGDIASMSSDLSNAATWASSRGVPLYMGEYGATVVYKGLITDPTSRTAWYREVSRIAKGLGISMAIWDHHLAFDINNIYGDLMVYNRATRECDRTILNAVMGH